MMRRVLVLLLMTFTPTLCAVPAEKEPPLPKDLPPYGELKPFVAPKVTAQKLSNGMTLWLVPRPGFPKVSFALAVRGGMASDPRDLPGFSDLIVATLDQGTKTRNAKKVAEDLQAAGGDLTGDADSDSIIAATSVLASQADPALEVLADVFQNATFPDDEVALAKRNAADNLRAQEAEPSFLARRALAKEVFGEHPYSIISPTQDSISKTTAEEIRRQYARRFRPDQTLLVAVGDFDPDRLISTLEKLFGNWKAPGEAPVAAPKPPSAANPHAVFFVERQGSVQTQFALGALGPTEASPDYAATQVATAIYGGMFGSRLIKNIREDKGYTYSPGSFLRRLREATLFQTSAAVRNEVTGAALNEIFYELNRMATSAPEEDEVARARRYLIGVRAISLQSEASVARQLAGLWVRGLPPEELGEESAKIGKVTAKEVEAAGAKYFPAAHETVVAVGEQKVIEQQLAPFGLKTEPAK